MVANWLYGVAYRTALKARAWRAKTLARERHVAELPEPANAQREHCHDLREMLDHELMHLGDTYRLPIDILVTVKEKDPAEKLVREWYEKLAGGYLDLKKADYELWVQEVKGRRVIRPTLIRRDNHGKNEYLATAEEGELKVDLVKGNLQIIMSKVVTLSRGGDRGYFESRSWSIPLAIEKAPPAKPMER